KFPFVRKANQTGDIRVTVAWIDPPGPINAGKLDDPTPALQHDLDVELLHPDGKLIYYPYALDLKDPIAPAVRVGPSNKDPHLQTNQVDNVEVIEAPPQSGTWNVLVKGSKLAADKSQEFAIVISGLQDLSN